MSDDRWTCVHGHTRQHITDDGLYICTPGLRASFLVQDLSPARAPMLSAESRKWATQADVAENVQQNASGTERGPTR